MLCFNRHNWGYSGRSCRCHSCFSLITCSAFLWASQRFILLTKMIPHITQSKICKSHSDPWNSTFHLVLLKLQTHSSIPSFNYTLYLNSKGVYTVTYNTWCNLHAVFDGCSSERLGERLFIHRSAYWKRQECLVHTSTVGALTFLFIYSFY